MKYLVPFIFLILPMAVIAQRPFEVVGQRGARGILPENTVGSMQKALELGATSLSLNVAATKDGQLVVSQQPYFNNEITTTPDGKSIGLKDEKKYNFFKMDYAEIARFDIGMKTHPRFPGQQKIAAAIPLLTTMLDEVETYVKSTRSIRPDYYIEPKMIPKGDDDFHPAPGKFVEMVMEIVSSKKLEKRVIIQSFDVRILQYVRDNYPRVRTSLLIDEKEDFEKNIAELGFSPTIYSPYSILVGKTMVDKCRALGIRLVPWTVNSAKDIQYFRALGVDGIITDYPNLMAQVPAEELPRVPKRKARKSKDQ